MTLQQVEQTRRADDVISDLQEPVKKLEERVRQLEANEGKAPYKYAILYDQKPNNTVGGTPATTAWTKHDLNTEQYDPDSIVSIASNQFILAAGTYIIRSRIQVYRTERAKIRIRNITAGTTAIVGTSAYEVNANAAGGSIGLIGAVTITVTTTFELQYWILNGGGGTEGLGVETNSGEVEIYAIVEIEKLA